MDVAALPDPAQTQKTFSPKTSSVVLREDYQKSRKGKLEEKQKEDEKDVKQEDTSKDAAASAQDGGDSHQQQQQQRPDTGLQTKTETTEAWDINLGRTILYISMVSEKGHLEFN